MPHCCYSGLRTFSSTFPSPWLWGKKKIAYQIEFFFSQQKWSSWCNQKEIWKKRKMIWKIWFGCIKLISKKKNSSDILSTLNPKIRKIKKNIIIALIYFISYLPTPLWLIISPIFLYFFQDNRAVIRLYTALGGLRIAYSGDNTESGM